MKLYVSHEDAKKVCTLVDECCEVWDNPTVWQSHVLGFISSAIGGSYSYLFLADRSSGTPCILDTRNEDPTQERRLGLLGGEAAVPGFERFFGGALEKGLECGRIRDYSQARVHDQSRYYQELTKPLGLHDRACAIGLSNGYLHVNLSIGRGPREKPFSDRDTHVLGLLANVLGPRVTTRLATTWQRGRHELTPRENEVLNALLQGDSEKQVAVRLGISTSTAHEHVIALYRYFGVHSRGELMAYFVRQRPTERACKRSRRSP